MSAFIDSETFEYIHGYFSGSAMLGFQVVWTLLPSNIIKWVMQRQ